MSTQNRTNAGSKAPVSSHPLFPAIVALWFGALFGLGSLAVRVSLIESLIISSHIDLIVPMAAPPLGMTARILIALTMAMIGIVAGAAIARRIARPRKVVPNRRRTAGRVRDERKEEFVRQVQVQQEEQRIAADKADALRRRALASGEVDGYGSHRDEAPLPGGAPQILDVTQFDLAAPGSFETDLAKTSTEAQTEEAPLDLTGFDRPQVAEAAYAEPARIEASAPVLESYGDDTDSFRAKFGNEKKPVEWTPEPPPGCAETFEATDGVDDAPEFVAEIAEAPTAVAAPELRRFDGPPGPAASGPVASQVDFAAPFAGLEAFADEAPAFREAELEAVTELAGPPEAEVAPFPPRGSAAERIASADLAELSPVELIERFALALRQRRHSGAFPAGLLEAAATFDLPFRPQPSQVPEVLAAMTPAAEPVAPQAPESLAAEAPAAQATQVAAPPLFPAISSVSSEIDDARVAATPLPLTLPAAMRPIEFGHHEENDDLPDYVPPRSFAMPRQAEKAVALGEPTEVLADNQQKHRLHLEFDWSQNHPPSPQVCPGKSATMSQSNPDGVPSDANDLMQQVTASLVESTANGQTEPSSGFEAEADVNEDGYSSLLALTRSAPLRQTFVRIDEPDSEFSQVEPVVIFPGQATRPGSRFARPPENAASVEPPAAPMPRLAELPLTGAPALRRFDAPGGAAPAAAASGTGAMQDPAEAERALRSALATLQRMSGAA